jgi:uncharacterized membrane protein SpoIIM required for sporulation
MKETKFIEQNKEKWSEYEQMLRSGQRDPERLNDLFIQITDDLSYARTFYPNRSVRVYLNHLGQRIFHNIYRGQRFPMQRLWRFWSRDLPQVMWESRLAMRLALGIFVLAFAIGVVSSMLNPDFARIILGDGYVDMTLQNIESGDVMAVYKSRDKTGMAAGIAANNLAVALQTALMGVLASIGTVAMLISNGIMVGAFQYFFIEKGVFWQSFLAIWIHGTLEISAIIIAGGAGLVAGSGLLFPGTYTRTQAFQLSMRRGLKIMVGIAPLIMLAAFFEGFLTRLTDVHDIIRGLFIALNLTFVIGYFVWWPRYLAKKGKFDRPNLEQHLPPDREQAVSFTAIKTTGEVFTDVFAIMRRHLRATLLSIFGGAALFTVLAVWLIDKPLIDLFDFSGSLFLWWPNEFGIYHGVQQFFGESITQPMRWVGIGILLVVSMIGLYMVEQEMPPEERHERNWLQRLWSCCALILPLVVMIYMLQFDTGFFTLLLGISVFPLMTMIGAVTYFERINFFSAVSRAFQLMRFMEMNTLGFLMLSLCFLIFWFFDSRVWGFFIQFFAWMVPSGTDNMQRFLMIFNTVSGAIALCFSWLLLVVGTALFYFSNREIVDANALYAGIEEIGKSRQIRGIAKE